MKVCGCALFEDAADALSALKADRDALSAALGAAVDQQCDYRDRCMRDRADMERARAALRPFAEAADALDDDHKDQRDIWEAGAAQDITAGDLRRAKAAISSSPAPVETPPAPYEPSEAEKHAAARGYAARRTIRTGESSLVHMDDIRAALIAAHNARSAKP